MKTIKLLTIATAAAIIAGGLTSASAQDTSDSAAGTRPGRGQILQRIAKKLNLTDDQKSQIKAVLSADKDTLKSLFGQLHDARKICVRPFTPMTQMKRPCVPRRPKSPAWKPIWRLNA
jgi:Spy/CpxP family protein refolding chaperone